MPPQGVPAIAAHLGWVDGLMQRLGDGGCVKCAFVTHHVMHNVEHGIQTQWGAEEKAWWVPGTHWEASKSVCIPSRVGCTTAAPWKVLQAPAVMMVVACRFTSYQVHVPFISKTGGSMHTGTHAHTCLWDHHRSLTGS